MLLYNKKEVKDMRPLKVKAIVLEDFNDKMNDGKLVEKDARIELAYGRFEELKELGYVKEDKSIISEKKEDK